MAVQVSDFDRFSFTLFMALAVHAIVVLGITFAPEPPRSSAQTMEITLSQFDDEEAPEKADFLAQTSQKGSGTEEQAMEMTSPQPAEVSQPEVAEIQPESATTAGDGENAREALALVDEMTDEEVDAMLAGLEPEVGDRAGEPGRDPEGDGTDESPGGAR